MIKPKVSVARKGKPTGYAKRFQVPRLRSPPSLEDTLTTEIVEADSEESD